MRQEVGHHVCGREARVKGQSGTMGLRSATQEFAELHCRLNGPHLTQTPPVERGAVTPLQRHPEAPS